MKKFRRLRDKLMTVVLLTTFSALTVANGIFLLYDINTYRATRTNEMTTQIEMLGYATVAALQFEDAEVARENLALLEFRPSVRAAAIYDASGSLFATYGRADANHEFPALPGDAGVQSDMSTLTVFNRILAEGRILGTAYILAEFPLGERILSYVGILSIVALVAMLVSVLVCFLSLIHI